MSFNTSFSKLSSDTNRFSFAFSCSSSFSLRAWSTFNPLYLAPSVVPLLHDIRFLTSLRQRLPVPDTNFNLPQQVHNLFRCMLLSSCHSQLLSFQFYRFSTSKKSAGPATRLEIAVQSSVIYPTQNA